MTEEKSIGNCDVTTCFFSGSVSWPSPKRGCLHGLKFLSTGVLETITRDDLNNLITECSGHVMSTMSKKLDYLIVGRDAGPVKLEKATQWGLKQVNEDDFLKFVSEKIESFDESAAPIDEAPKKGKKIPKKQKLERPKKKTGTKNKHESSDDSESSEDETSPSPKKKVKG